MTKTSDKQTTRLRGNTLIRDKVSVSTTYTQHQLWRVLIIRGQTSSLYPVQLAGTGASIVEGYKRSNPGDSLGTGLRQERTSPLSLREALALIPSHIAARTRFFLLQNGTDTPMRSQLRIDSTRVKLTNGPAVRCVVVALSVIMWIV